MQFALPALLFEIGASTPLHGVSMLLGLSTSLLGVCTPLGAAGRDRRFAKHLARSMSVM
jgi:hypothetical protein